MYARRVKDRELTFDFAEGLLKDNLLVVDRETGSLWSQLHGKAVDGPMKGTPLEVIPSLQATWKFWRTRHPDTRVLVVENRRGKPYYYFRPGTPREERNPGLHDISRVGLGLVVGGESMFFPFHELNRAGLPLELRMGGEAVTVHYRKKALTAWGEDEKGNLLPGVVAYRSGWLSFHPETKFFAFKKFPP